MAGIALPAEGWNEAVGIGKESTYGTGVGASVWYRNASISLKKLDDLEALAATPGVPLEMTYSATRPRSRLGVPQVAGDIVFLLETDDVGFILEQLLGTGAFTSNGGGATGAHLHVFSMPTAPTAMTDSLSITRLTGGQSYRYTGAVITQLAFRGQPNQTIRVTASFVARNAEKISPTFGSASTAPFLEFYGAQFRYDAIGTLPDSADALSGADAMNAFSATIVRPVESRQRAGDDERGIGEPQLNGPYSGMIEITKDHVDSTFQDIAFASTIPGRHRYTTLWMDSYQVIASAVNHSIEIRQPASAIMSDTGEYSGGFGIVPETVRSKATYDGTNAPVQVRLVNETGSGSYSA